MKMTHLKVNYPLVQEQILKTSKYKYICKL